MNKAQEFIYIDSNATTPIDPQVCERIKDVLLKEYGNPSSLHFVGRRAYKLISEAREYLSYSLPGGPWNVIFTSGGTEADALAVLSHGYPSKKRLKIMISSIEHPAVRENALYLKERGVKEVIEIPVDNNGIVDLGFIKEYVNEETSLLAVMLANNEIGTIQPIEEIGRWLKKFFPTVHFHVDIVAALGQMKITDLLLEHVDSIAVSAHKIYGPKGIGALLYKGKAKIKPLWKGGDQEGGIRPGTENVIGVIGLFEAVKILNENLDLLLDKLKRLQSLLVNYIITELPEAKLLGDPQKRTVTNVTLAYPGIESEVLLHQLEEFGIIASSGSACHSRLKGYSHVIKAIGLKGKWAITRFGLHKFLTEEDIERVGVAYINSIKKLKRS